jgi:inhibitor of cysteine peptidase
MRFFRFFLMLWVCLFSMDAWSLPEQIKLDASCSSFEVRLSSNRTTGFQWTLESYDKARFCCVKSDYVVSDTTRMGAPGERVFYFKQKENTTCPESTVLRFRHARSWESDSGTQTEVTVHFSEKKV